MVLIFCFGSVIVDFNVIETFVFFLVLLQSLDMTCKFGVITRISVLIFIVQYKYLIIC